MEKSDVVVVGAGVVGLAAGAELARRGKKPLLVERRDGFGRETSSRNSEVIHGGMYYPAGSLKARLCVEGNRLLYEVCEKNGIACRAAGKLIVAVGASDDEKLDALLRSGRENGVRDFQRLSTPEIHSLEPAITAHGALFCTSTGIIDSHALMHYYEQQIEKADGVIAYGCEVIGCCVEQGGFRITVRDTDKEVLEIQANQVVNAAGLFSDRIAAMTGIDIDKAGYRLYPCKGSYFSLSNRHRKKLHHLVYPVPTAVSLGIHVVLRLDGSVQLGPDAEYTENPTCDVDVNKQMEFYSRGKTYLPFLEPGDLSPYQAGIRAKLQKPGEGFRDFVIREESSLGYPDLVNCIGIESPGLTAAPAIGNMVADLLE